MKKFIAIAVAITIAFTMCVCAVVSADEIESVTEASTEAPTEEVTEAQTEDHAEDPAEAEAVEIVEDTAEDPTEVSTEEATEPTHEVYSETVDAERIAENPAEAPPEEPTEENYNCYDPDQDMGIGMYNPYMYCPVAPVYNHRFGFGYIDEGVYLFDEVGHCWGINNPDLHSGAVGFIYDTRGTDNITDDAVVLIMADWPNWIEEAICSD